MITKKELSKLRKSLPKGAIKIISINTGYVTTYVWQVLNEQRWNQKIIDAAIELAKQTKEKIETAKNDIANL